MLLERRPVREVHGARQVAFQRARPGGCVQRRPTRPVLRRAIERAAAGARRGRHWVLRLRRALSTTQFPFPNQHVRTCR